MAEFRLLGPVEVWVGRRLLDAGQPRQRAVLAALLADVGRVVDTETLVDHHLHSAYAADRLLHPARDPIPVPLDPPAPGTAVPHLPDAAAALAWLGAELDALRAILRHAEQAGRHASAWQLAWALDTFLHRQGYWHDLAIAWKIGLRAADRLDQPVARAAAYRHLAGVRIRLHQYPEADADLRRALELYAGVGDRAGQAYAHHHLATLREREGRLDDAIGHGHQALAQYRDLGDDRGQANALNAIGWCESLLGEHERAVEHCERALVLFERVGDRFGAALTWDSLGYAHQHLGRHREAGDCYERAVTLFREVGDRYNESIGLDHLGDGRLAAGDRGGAGAAWRRALAILTGLGHPDADAVRAKLGALDQPSSARR